MYFVGIANGKSTTPNKIYLPFKTPNGDESDKPSIYT